MTDQKALDGALLKGATTIEQSQSDIESTLKNLESKLSGIGSSWQGEAAVVIPERHGGVADRGRQGYVGSHRAAHRAAFV